MRLSMGCVYRSHDRSNVLSYSTTPRFSMGNVCVESRAAKSAAGLFLWRGAQKFAAEISTARRSMPVADLKLRLNGPGRSLSRL